MRLDSAITAAAPLAPDQDAGSNTDLKCPACQDGHRLTSRRLGEDKLTILECGQCAGFWIGHEAFRELVELTARDVARRHDPRIAAARSGQI